MAGFDSPQLHVNNYIGKHAVVKKGSLQDRCGKIVQQNEKTFEVTMEMVPNKDRHIFRITDLIIE